MLINEHVVKVYAELDRYELSAFDTCTLNDFIESICKSWLDLTAEINRLHQCAAFFRCCALSGEIPTMAIDEFEVSDGALRHMRR